jgi:hypothetical protein
VRLSFVLFLVAALAANAIAGCVGTRSDAGSLVPAESPLLRPTVVALVDTGINPYHDIFASKNTGLDFAGLDPSVVVVPLAKDGQYDQRVRADEGFWKGVERERLYAFAGTRIMAIDFSDHSEDRILDVQDHGAGTASLVAKYDPDAVIVMVQVHPTYCVPPTTCLSNPTTARGLAWAASQPWIDVISVSVGLYADHYDSGRLHPEVDAFLAASRLAVQNGKLLVVGSGNTVTPSVSSYLCGPPWVIDVGGAQREQQGQAFLANSAVDVVANFTETVASSSDTTATRWAAGTSLSTPIVAATLSRSIHEARALVGQTDGIVDGALVHGKLPHGSNFRATNRDLRNALNASARPWNATEWTPTSLLSVDPQNAYAYSSAPIVLAPAQMGWGYVDSTLAPEIARRALAHDFARAPSPADEYMRAYATLRETIWD